MVVGIPSLFGLANAPDSSAILHPGPPPARNIYLSFQGVGFTSGMRRTFDVICGANPPTITDGYGKWQVLSRPYQRGLTIPQGYDPASMTVDIIFGHWLNGWNQSDTIGQQVEDDIGTLDWMGGGSFVAGPSPIVYVFSHANYGGDTPLIPRQYAGLPWIISNGSGSGIEWGTAYRNKSGYRIWQEATVTLQHYLNLGAPPAADTNKKGSYFKTIAGRDTAMKIAGAPAINSPTVDVRQLAAQICSSNKNNPVKGTSIRLTRKATTWQMRAGLEIWVPDHMVV